LFFSPNLEDRFATPLGVLGLERRLLRASAAAAAAEEEEET